MYDSVGERPFDNYRTPITEPSYFFGRSELIHTMLKFPFQVRILLGGRRLGKTSALRAIEWNLLDPNNNPDRNPNSKYFRRAFPVLIDLKLEQPKDLDNLRYILIARLREAMERWREIPVTNINQMYPEFLNQVKGAEVTLNFLSSLNINCNINNPDTEKRLNNDNFRLAFLKTKEELRKQKELNFQGVCFLIDGAEFIVRQTWATDAWSYLRGLKDTDIAIKSALGLLLSGYRDLKEYQQRVGSPLLNIAEIEWLTTLSEEDTRKLICDRVSHMSQTYEAEKENIFLSEDAIAQIIEWSGCHPYLIQQSLNMIFDSNQQCELEQQCLDTHLINKLLQHHDKDFSSWWNAEHLSGCFSEDERKIYCTLIKQRQATPKDLAKNTSFSRFKVSEALEVMAGTGVIHLLDDESYILGSRLFQEWVKDLTSNTLSPTTSESDPEKQAQQVLLDKQLCKQNQTQINYQDFQIIVDKNYYIRASSEQGEVKNQLLLDINKIKLTLKLIELNQTDTELLKALGHELYQALFPDKINARFHATLASAQTNQESVRLRLIFESPELASLPWEFLYDEDTNTFLGNNTETVLSRYIDIPLKKSDLKAVSLPLKVLLVISTPTDLATLDIVGEEKLIQEALKTHIETKNIELDILQTATRREIQQKLNEKHYEVFHFIGHGEFENNKGYIALIDEAGKAKYMDDENFANFFLGSHNVGLVILNSCQGAKVASNQAMRGTAPNLVRRGIPAVIAMQYSIFDNTAKLFTDEFYRTLALGYPIDAAIQKTRNAISMECGLDRRDFATPVLYMRAKDGIILSGFTSPEKLDIS